MPPKNRPVAPLMSRSVASQASSPAASASMPSGTPSQTSVRLAALETMMENIAKQVERLAEAAIHANIAAPTAPPPPEVQPQPNEQVNMPVQVDDAFEKVLSAFDRRNLKEFNGKGNMENMEEWLLDMDKAMNIINCDEVHKTRLAAYKLAGPAWNWWEVERRKLGRDPKWAEFKELFLKKFLSRAEKAAKAYEFRTLVQGRQSVNEYESKFTDLARYAPSLVTDEEEKVRRFMDGLHPSIHRMMLETEGCTFAKVVRRAQNIERGLQIVSRKEDSIARNRDQGQFKRARIQGEGSSKGKDNDNKLQHQNLHGGHREVPSRGRHHNRGKHPNRGKHNKVKYVDPCNKQDKQVDKVESHVGHVKSWVPKVEISLEKDNNNSYTPTLMPPQWKKLTGRLM